MKAVKVIEIKGKFTKEAMPKGYWRVVLSDERKCVVESGSKNNMKNLCVHFPGEYDMKLLRRIEKAVLEFRCGNWNVKRPATDSIDGWIIRDIVNSPSWKRGE